MSLNFKSFIKNKSLFVIIVPSLILILGIVVYLAEKKVAEAAITLNPDNEETILLGKSVYVQNLSLIHI